MPSGFNGAGFDSQAEVHVPALPDEILMRIVCLSFRGARPSMDINCPGTGAGVGGWNGPRRSSFTCSQVRTAGTGRRLYAMRMLRFCALTCRPQFQRTFMMTRSTCTCSHWQHQAESRPSWVDHPAEQCQHFGARMMGGRACCFFGRWLCMYFVKMSDFLRNLRRPWRWNNQRIQLDTGLRRR